MDLIAPSYGNGKTVAYTDTAGSTAVFPVGAQGVMVWSTTNCYVKVGVGATATSSDCPITAFTPVLIRVPNVGEPWRVSAIRVTTSGDVYAIPVDGANG
jgi:hypothetical protein